MIQKKKNVAGEWHLVSTEAVEKITKYLSHYGISKELRAQIKGNRIGRVICAFEGDRVHVVTKSRSSEKRRTLERENARLYKQALKAIA